MLLRIFVPIALAAAAAPALSQAGEAALTAELEVLAAKGNAEAAYHAGVAYQMGINGVGKDSKKAFDYFKQSAEGGDPLGAYKLGSFYDGQGEGVVDDDAELALTHKLVAAKAGYSLAQHDVAKFFYEKDQPDQAVEWLIEAAKQGYRESLQALASLHAGEGKVAKEHGQELRLSVADAGRLDRQGAGESAADAAGPACQAQPGRKIRGAMRSSPAGNSSRPSSPCTLCAGGSARQRRLRRPCQGSRQPLLKVQRPGRNR